MRYPSSPFWRTLLLSLLALTPLLKAEKLVITRSTAAGDYLQKRMVDGKRQRQTYVFMPGRYFAGNTHDNSLDRASFRTIAERLALDLRAQDFYPAESLAKADLVLIVHWGVTAGRNRDSVAMALSMESLASMNLEGAEAQRQLDEANARGDLEGAGRARDNLTALESETRSEIRNIDRNQSAATGEDSATLLGLAAALRKDDGTLFDYERRKTLFGLTQEECYFVIVMACDAPTLFNEKRLKRVWTLRTGISSAGVNFPEALDRMTNMASHYFGTRQEGVTFDYPGERKRKETVTLGELIVIGTANR